MHKEQQIRFATIGTNFITAQFLKAAKGHKELIYQCTYSREDQKAEDFANAHGARQWCSELEELAGSPEVDAVYIASPNGLHFSQAAMMIEAGKHVLCEKTITTNAEEFNILVEKARQNGVVLMEAMRSVFTPGFEQLQDAVKALGQIRRVSFQYCQYSSRYDNYKKGIIENAFNPKFSNGALMDIGVYCIYPLVTLFGAPERIMADAIMLENGVDGAGTVLAHYKEFQAELTYSKIADGYIENQIQGEEGTLCFNHITNPCRFKTVFRNGYISTVTLPELQNNMSYEIGKWICFIQEKNINHDYLNHSQKTLETMDCVRKQLGIIFPGDKKWM
ncbi:Gfo/Idh/MocA family protein [Eubacterium barkeri]|uniref:Predicted dehydrogenase n=1 Tax=Eubacterium barkeri TaxID=1528 RepID=A0A1H3JKI1_EUBBA|nr:Gfo/Idh/MocA family oxidoreductase [Eubacterium barkeri]SDY40411.1 Predicted dehydrogenase [Eubacterium barkeri]